jgi:hypothetical protein
VKFAVVAPVVRTPPQSAGSSNSSFSQSSATTSSRAPSGDETQANEFWSNADASQSAPSAAGVTPPVTKWKKRGPGERTTAPAPSASAPSAASAPSPSSGSGPENLSAASAEPALATGADWSAARNSCAESAAARRTVAVSSRIRA